MSSVQERMLQVLEDIRDTAIIRQSFSFGPNRIVVGKGKLYVVDWGETSFVFSDEGLARKALAAMRAVGMKVTGPRAETLLHDDFKEFEAKYIAPQAARIAAWKKQEPAHKWFESNLDREFRLTKDLEFGMRTYSGTGILPAGSTVQPTWMGHYKLSVAEKLQTGGNVHYSVDFKGLFDEDNPTPPDEKLLATAIRIVDFVKKHSVPV